LEKTTKINQLLDKIIESKGFKKSDQYAKVLRFLVEAHLSNTPIKETTLESELPDIFGLDNSYDGKVRVYMHNIRKKLDEYYLTEGVDDTYIFKIIKGQYNLSIEKKNNASRKFFTKKLVSISVVALLLLLFTFWLLSLRFLPKNLWSNFMQNKSKTTCYIADHYTVWGRVDNKAYASVHFEGVKTESDYDQFIQDQNLNDSWFKKNSYSFVTKMGPITASKISYWFAQFDKEIEVRMESEFAPNDITENNIIFIGQQKTLDGLKGLFLRDSKKFAYSNLNFILKETNQKLADSISNPISNEYVMVSYNPISKDGNDILFFASNNDIGVMATVDSFTDPEWLNRFYENLPSKSSYFNALFAVKGLERTNIECELIAIEVLD